VRAVAASMLTAIYHMLKNGTFYQDLGPEHFQRGPSTTQIKRLVQKLSSLGYEVRLKPPVDGRRWGCGTLSFFLGRELPSATDCSPRSPGVASLRRGFRFFSCTTLDQTTADHKKWVASTLPSCGTTAHFAQVVAGRITMRQ